jgi:hypothetical protein
VGTELADVRGAAAIALANLMEDVSSIHKTAETLAVQVAEVPPRDDDGFHGELTGAVVREHQLRGRKLLDEAVAMQAEFQAVAKLYAEDAKTATLEEFFGAIVKFLDLFDKSRREVIERRRKAEKKKQDDAKEAARRERKKEFAVNAGLDEALLAREKQAEIARRAAESEVDPEMQELAQRMRSERKQARSKKSVSAQGEQMGPQDASPPQELAVPPKPIAAPVKEEVKLTVAETATVFAEKKPKKVLKKDWFKAE